MNDLELQGALRTAIEEAALPVSAAEAMLRAGGMTSYERPVSRARLLTTSLGVVAAAVVAVALVFVVLSLVPPATGTGRSTTPTTRPGKVNLKNVLPLALVTCIEFPPASDGCTVSTDEARQMLGVNVPDPGYIPSGWTLGSRTIRGWPAGYFGQAKSVSDFNEYWFLPGSGPDSGSKVTRLIQLEVHLAAQGTNSLPGWQAFVLASGAEATGFLDDGSAHLVWLYQGMGLKVTTYGISAQETLRFVNELQFPSS